MSNLPTDEEICKQLLELAQTPEQIQYLTMNNQSVLADKVKALKEEVQYEEDRRRIDNYRNGGAEAAYMNVIMKLVKESRNYYD